MQTAASSSARDVYRIARACCDTRGAAPQGADPSRVREGAVLADREARDPVQANGEVVEVALGAAIELLLVVAAGPFLVERLLVALERLEVVGVAEVRAQLVLFALGIEVQERVGHGRTLAQGPLLPWPHRARTQCRPVEPRELPGARARARRLLAPDR